MDSESAITQSGAMPEGFYWFTPGVSGQAMGFDGIRTVVSVLPGKSPGLSNGFTLSAWVALEAYPWTWLAVVDQESDQQAGYYLGIHPEGYPGLWVAVGNMWQACSSNVKLPLYEWNHLAGTWSPDDGLRLYVNGREAASLKTVGAFRPAQGQDIFIGRNHTPRLLYGSIRESHPTKCSLEGLVDEVRIEAGAQSASMVADRYAAEHPSGQRPLNPPRLPAGPDGPGNFGATYTRLQFTNAWEHNWRVGDHPDILVRFDKAPYRFVFWRGTSFIPCWVTDNGIWYTNEFFETQEVPQRVSGEPMADKQTRNSHVRIIESNDARVVVHWRYSPLYTDYSYAHIDPETGWSDWVDEYYTLYPDGIGVRKISLHSMRPYVVPGKDPGMGGFREWHESIIINPPGTAPHDNIQTQGLTLANMAGRSITYSWADGTPENYDKPDLVIPGYLRRERPGSRRAWLMDIPDPNIHLVHLKAAHSPFVIVPPDSVMVDCYASEMKRDRSIFPWWNHWPVAQIESNGRWANAPDRTSHSSLTHIMWPPYEEGRQSVTKIMLHGMTGGAATDLLPLAKSWIEPAELRVVEGAATNPRYDPAQRAYVLTCTRPDMQGGLRLRLNSSNDHPAINPAIVLTGWGDRPAAVSIDGRTAEPGKEYRIGYRQDVESTDLVLWIDRTATVPMEIGIRVSEQSFRDQ